MVLHPLPRVLRTPPSPLNPEPSALMVVPLVVLQVWAQKKRVEGFDDRSFATDELEATGSGRLVNPKP